MMGRQDRDQRQLFYEFCLDEMIPRDYLLQRINVFATAVLTDLHQQLKAFYSDIGRPSVDPELMNRMLLVGYCYGIRHERRLCQEVALHLAFRWFCKLDLDDKVPHHSTFSVNRLGRFRESEILRHIFERVVAACMVAGLVKGEGFAVDASVMEANASRYHGKAPDELDWTDAQRQKRAVAEYLAGLEAEAQDQEGKDNRSGGSDATPTAKPDRKPPKVISPSDPSSAWTAKANKRVQFGYGLNYLIDVEHAVIVDVEPTPARTYDEVESTKTMLDRTERRFSLKPKRLAADTAYGTGRFLGWLVGPKDPVFNPIFRKNFDQALRDLGWIDASNIRVEYYDAGGDFERLRKLAKESVELHPDLIVAVNTPLVAAVIAETRTVPVVFGLVSDPVGSGFVQSYARPGGNATGFAYAGRDLVSKWLELLKEVSPAITRVALLFNPDAAPGRGSYYVRPFEAAAVSLAITPIVAPVRNAEEIERLISRLEGQPPGGLVVTPDYFIASQRELIIAVAARRKVPAMYFLPQFVITGGLMSYSIDDP